MNRGLNYIINLIDGSFGRGMDAAAAKTSALDNLVNKVGATLAVAFSVDKLKDLSEKTTEVYSKMQTYDNVIKFASRDGEEYAKNQAFISKTIGDMKLPLFETTDGFAKLEGSMKGSSLEGEAARQIFKGTSEAVTVMHLDAATANSVFYAMQNIMSKGKLQSQELTLQLGNALPGALGTAARAMNMTTAELQKQMELGNISAEVFLPKFAAELHKTYGPGMQNAVHSLVGKMNEANNEILIQESAVGQKLNPVWLGYLHLQAKGLEIVSKSVDFISEHSNVIKALAGAIGLASAAYVVNIGLQKLSLWYNGLSTAAIIANTLATEGWAGAQVALNIAMEANPIGAVITALALLGIAIAAVMDNYDKLTAKYQSQSGKNIQNAVKAERAALAGLADDYTGLGGMSRKDAEKKAIALESQKLNNQIAGLDAAIKGAKGDDLLALQSKRTYAMAQKGVLNDADIFKQPAGKASGLPGAPGVGGGKSSGSVGSGSTTRNVTVNIQNLVKEINVHAATVKESGRDLEKEMTGILVRALRDAEIAIG